MATSGTDGVASRPRVVVLVVTHDPGSWLTETLASLARQDYGRYGVMVIEAGETAGLQAQVHEVLPAAEVHQLGKDPAAVGYGAAADEVLAGGSAEVPVDDADYFLFCHDDVVLDSTALTALVETSLDCGAEIVGPKLVDWDDPRRLLQMGQTVSPTASALPLLERGEVDQGQYDGRREVFAVTGGAILMRAALFRRIGGFDEAISAPGDDLSLCWRARLAGARVVVTSAARARHREGWLERMGRADRQRLTARHRVRLLLTCSGSTRRRVLFPLLAAILVLRGSVAVCAGRFTDARAFLVPCVWNLWHWRSKRIARRQVKRFRKVRDRDLRPLQATWSPLRFVHRRQVATPVSVGGGLGPQQRATAGIAARQQAARSRRSRAKNAWTPAAVTVACVLAGLLVMGGRHLFTRGVPEVGTLMAFGAPGDLFREWWTGWRRTGLGSEAPIPLLFAALSALGTLVGGNMGLLRTLLTAGLLPLGAFGAFRMLRPRRGGSGRLADQQRPLGSPWAGLGAALAYAAIPLPYTALAMGDWRTLAMYAAAPWLVARLLGASLTPSRRRHREQDEEFGEEPDEVDASEGQHRQDHRWPRGRLRLGVAGLLRDMVALGLLGGVLALVVPAAGVLILAVAAGLAVGGLLAFEPRGQTRLFVVALGGAGLALLLHLPWLVNAVLVRGDVSVWWGLDRLPRRSSAAALPLDLDSDPAVWALLGAAGLALLIGKDWRLSWAIRGWVLAGAAYGLVWVAGAGELGLDSVSLPAMEHLLVIAGAGIALAVGCGVAAAEADTAGRFRRFGAKRILAALGIVALVGACTPTAERALDGDWGMPPSDFTSLLDEVEEDVADVPSRVLWVGHPDLIPGDGWTTSDGDIAYATTLEKAYPGVTELMPGPESDATERLEQAIAAMRAGETARLGGELAPMAVEYVAVPLQAAPAAPAEDGQEVPQDVLDGLASQLDLQRVTLDPSLVIYRNMAALPERAEVLVPGVDDLPLASEGWPEDLPTAEQVALSDANAAKPALDDTTDGRRARGAAGGRLPGSSVLIQAVAESPSWELSVDGVRAERRNAYGWANSFIVAAPGWGELSYITPWRYRGLQLTQAGLWLSAVVVVLLTRARLTSTSSVGRETRARPESGRFADGPAPVARRISLPQDDDEYVRLVAGLWDPDPDREEDEPDGVVRVIKADAELTDDDDAAAPGTDPVDADATAGHVGAQA